MKKVGKELVADAKAAAMSTKKETGPGKGKDLLSLLVRANLASDGPKLSDEEVIARAPPIRLYVFMF
jgi:cytochrome P450